MRTGNKTHSFFIAAMMSLLNISPSFADCIYDQLHALFENSTDADIRRFANESARPELIETLDLYHRFVNGDPALKALLPENKIYPILADETMTYYPKVLHETLKKMESLPAPHGVEQFKQSLREVLVDKVPANTIEGRIHGLDLKTPESYRRALGDMTLTEVQNLVHGGDPLHPTPDSLLGKYLAESQAQTVVRTFPVGVPLPGQDAARIKQGPERLVIGIDDATFPIFEKYFNRQELLWFFGHGQLAQGGKIFSYTQDGAAYRIPTRVNETVPVILTKTTEAQRANESFQFMIKAKLGSNYTFDTYMSTPWQIPGYCEPGGYSGNCTHWIGNFPMGDKLVDHFTFPGNKAANKAPVVTPLRPYDVNHPAIQARWPNMTDYDKRLMKRVMGAPLAHEQFSYAIGMGTQSEREQFVNPGWVVATLLGKAPVEREGFVFVKVADHTQPIAADFQPYYENPW